MRSQKTILTSQPHSAPVATDYELRDGSRVAVMGGGPAGSFFALSLIGMARRMAIDVEIDIFEPRDFDTPGAVGCNMCGGIISESLVQTLAAEGIRLPPGVVQWGIEAYVLHMDVGSAPIKTPSQERRIGAIFRGSGPNIPHGTPIRSFDGYLLNMALQRGANQVPERVTAVQWNDGRPVVSTRGRAPKQYDLLIVAVGANSAALRLFDETDLAYRPPSTTKTAIREYYLGAEAIREKMGNAMHVFLLDIPRLKFGAAIPKGDFVTVVLLGDDIDTKLVDAFLHAPELKRSMPSGWNPGQTACQCAPRMNVGSAVQPFGDRIVFIGDSAVNRLYKDGIGGAYRAAKAAAVTAVFQGVSADAFRRTYLPVCQNIDGDNRYGHFIFWVTRLFQHHSFARSALLRMMESEQEAPAQPQRMSSVLWDTFTGSAPYREIFWRTLQPAFLTSLARHTIGSVLGSRRRWRPSETHSRSGPSAGSGWGASAGS